MSKCAAILKWPGTIAVAVLVGVIGSMAGQAQDTKQGTDFDAAKLCGQWKYLSGMRAGNPASDENLASLVTIDNKEFTLSSPTGNFVIAYKLNAQKNPIEVDFEITAGPVPEGKAIGIIKMSGDRITLCYDPTGATRPEKFESTAENGCHLFELARAAFDLGKLVGKWKYESGERAGEKIAPERIASVVTISKDKFIVPAGPDGEFVMAFTIDDKQHPIAIDLTIESGPAPEGKAIGIIKLENNKLTFCYDPTGTKRPAEFKTTAENGCFMFVLNKQADEAEKKDESKTTGSAEGKGKGPAK